MAKQPAKGRKTPAKAAPKPKAADAAAQPKPIVEKPQEAKPAVVVKEPVKSEPKPMPKRKDEAKPEAPAKPDQKPDQPTAAVTPAPAPKQSSGFIPMLLGGLIAGGIGYGIAYFTLPRPDPMLASKVSTQAKTIADLRNDVAAIPVVDPAQFEAAATARGTLDTRITEIEGQFADLLGQPAADGSLSGAAIAAYQLELQKLRDEVDGLRGTAVAELAAARDQAASISENAEAAARAAAARSALARVQGAIETGAPMGAPLDALAEALQSDVPAALTAVRDGVPTLATLQDDFSDLARESLAEARTQGVSGEAEGGFAAFLRTQLNVRSTAPQEGDTVDAILSRAQDAVRKGQLPAALTEITGLPDAARGVLSDWQAQAQMRADAQAAAAELSTQLNAN